MVLGVAARPVSDRASQRRVLDTLQGEAEWCQHEAREARAGPAAGTGEAASPSRTEGGAAAAAGDAGWSHREGRCKRVPK